MRGNVLELKEINNEIPDAIESGISKQPQLLHTSSEFDEIKFVGKLTTRANTILREITKRSK